MSPLNSDFFMKATPVKKVGFPETALRFISIFPTSFENNLLPKVFLVVILCRIVCHSNKKTGKKIPENMLMPLRDERLDPVAKGRLLAYPKYVPNPH